MTPADIPTSSFTELYGEAAPALFTWAHVRLQAPLRAQLDPEDVLQEVCCRAYDRFESFDASLGSFRSWVFGIANNVLREALLSLRHLPKAEPARAEWSHLPWDDLPDDATSISRRVVRSESIAAFVARLDGLTEEEKKLLIYRGLEGLRHAEIASLLGLSVDAAEKRWQRLLQKFQAKGALPEFLHS